MAEEGHYLTDVVNDHAVEFVEEFGTKADPFFLYVAHSAPHWPLQALPEDISKYQGKYRKGWMADTKSGRWKARALSRFSEERRERVTPLFIGSMKGAE